MLWPKGELGKKVVLHHGLDGGVWIRKFWFVGIPANATLL